jgi:hypothetical protein
MDQDPEHLADEPPTQVSQWLITAPRRGRARRLVVFALVLLIAAIILVGLLELTSAFFPQ